MSESLRGRRPEEVTHSSAFSRRGQKYLLSHRRGGENEKEKESVLLSVEEERIGRA